LIKLTDGLATTLQILKIDWIFMNEKDMWKPVLQHMGESFSPLESFSLNQLCEGVEDGKGHRVVFSKLLKSAETQAPRHWVRGSPGLHLYHYKKNKKVMKRSK
jgi:hypothetical protein